ncbi:MAG: CcdB family protein [Proteobacteria bacterium]|nr:CcdB family protein [Pseudomonadota bacterium]
MIRQFDVFPNPSKRGRAERPFVVVIQSSFVAGVSSQLCAPLVVEGELHPDRRLNPAFRIGDQILYLHPVEITPIPARLLRTVAANLGSERDRIIAALDLVFTGI